MNLIPSAKPIRIRIKSGGEEHSSVESLRSNYSFADIAELLADGRLHKWLKQKREFEAAKIALDYTGRKIEKDSIEFLKLTASIFHIPFSESLQIDNVAAIWKKSYPQSYKNYAFDFGKFDDIPSALALYRERPIDDIRNWDTIFSKLLKSVSAGEMLHYFKSQKDCIPISDGCWLEVCKSFICTSQPGELFEMGKILYNNSHFTDQARLLIMKSAEKGYHHAKLWLTENDVSSIIDEFIRLPESFKKNHEFSGKPNITNFLYILSRMYNTSTMASDSEIETAGNFQKYLEVTNAFWYITANNKREGIARLKDIAKRYPSYEAPAMLIKALSDRTSINGTQVHNLSYGKAIKFVANHVKLELNHGRVGN